MVIAGWSQASKLVHEVFILPALRAPRQRELRLLVLPDGNKRSDPSNGGYARGARKVVEIAEHLARRDDVAMMVACVLSPENVAARTDGFFASLHAGFVHLGAQIARQGTLVASGVRAELCGDLEPLRARGGSAVALADAIEAVIAQTRVVTEPALRLLFGVGYRSTTPRDLDLDMVLRTGLEDEAALRLSGLCSHPSIANHAMTKLWPDVTAGDVDAIIEATRRHRTPGFSMGYSPEEIVAIVRAFGGVPLDRPVRASLVTHASPAAMAEALEPLYAERAPRDVAVTCAFDGGDASSGPGTWPGARHELRILLGEPRGELSSQARYRSMLAPGQRHPLLVLPEWHYGYATIHPCEATPAGIVEGLRAAERFSATHVALLGAERDVEPRAGARASMCPEPRSPS